MNFREKIKNEIIVLDGAMGTQLQKASIPLGTLPEEWNITHPDVIERIHSEYLEAGSDVVYANTFGANSFKYGERTDAVVKAAVKCAKRAVKKHGGGYVALDIGPLGKLLKPLGELDFEDAVNCFKTTVKAGYEAGCDLVVIETMNDTFELKAAILAVRETCDLPIIATCVFDASHKLMTGADPEAVVALCEGLGVDMIGLNCSLGPREMLPVVERFVECASVPVAVKPNAGLPRECNGKTCYDVYPEEFAVLMKPIIDLGAGAVGGCCGTSPEYIRCLTPIAKGAVKKPVEYKNITVVSSYTHAVRIGSEPVLIGERINPTGKKRLKEALMAHDISYVLREAVSQSEKGVHILDVNVGLPDIDEVSLLAEAVCEIQSVSDLPLQIDTADPAAMEKALRTYNGKAMINSVSGKREVMDAVFPLVKKYGGVVVALTLDENGIPETSEGRIKIAEKIVCEARKYGISKKDIVIDTLAMAVSADSTAPEAALSSLEYIRHQMGINTSLGVSNVSFGLPRRDFINGTFFAMALNRGLSAAIINPNSDEMIKTYRGYCALTGYDKNCLKYIEYASSVEKTEAVKSEENGLKYYIEKGVAKEAEKAVKELLATRSSLDVINLEIIPALDEVGRKFESKKLFLPQLLMSAEAASAAFEVVKSSIRGEASGKKLKVVLATVKGDIHDIGKNIVKTLLDNYGFSVTDLGRDVAPEAVAEAVKNGGAEVCGLSALMTTTVASMKDTIELLREHCPMCKIIVGGAVLTEEYAEKIGADYYASDAMSTVRICEQLESKKKRD